MMVSQTKMTAQFNRNISQDGTNFQQVLVKKRSTRAGGNCWKMGAKFTFLPLTWSIFDGFSKLFFLLKAGLHCQLLKKLMRNCVPSSASPVYSIGKNTNFLSLKCQFTLMSSTACETGILFIAASLRSCSTSSRCCCNAVFIWNIKSSLVSLF